MLVRVEVAGATLVPAQLGKRLVAFEMHIVRVHVAIHPDALMTVLLADEDHLPAPCAAMLLPRLAFFTADRFNAHQVTGSERAGPRRGNTPRREWLRYLGQSRKRPRDGLALLRKGFAQA